jgi:hypothetical protein
LVLFIPPGSDNVIVIWDASNVVIGLSLARLVVLILVDILILAEHFGDFIPAKLNEACA